jgi:hypothetical protein
VKEGSLHYIFERNLHFTYFNGSGGLVVKVTASQPMDHGFEP